MDERAITLRGGGSGGGGQSAHLGCHSINEAPDISSTSNPGLVEASDPLSVPF